MASSPGDSLSNNRWEDIRRRVRGRGYAHGIKSLDGKRLGSILTRRQLRLQRNGEDHVRVGAYQTIAVPG